MSFASLTIIFKIQSAFGQESQQLPPVVLFMLWGTVIVFLG